jgi:hypothetical protein
VQALALREQIYPLKFNPAELFGPEFRTHGRVKGFAPLVLKLTKRSAFRIRRSMSESSLPGRSMLDVQFSLDHVFSVIHRSIQTQRSPQLNIEKVGKAPAIC